VLDQEQRLADLERVAYPLIEHVAYEYSSIYGYALRTAMDNRHSDPEILRELYATRGDDDDVILSAQRVLRRTK
jgi:hypothetical protein